MASIITGLIPKLGFEIVLERLGVILFEELTNQKTLTAFNDDFEVFIDRQTPYDKSEDVVIMLSLSDNSFSGKTQMDAQGNVTYFIDIYNTAKESASISGSLASSNMSLRFAGIIRSILSTTKYKTLGFVPGLIGGTMVEQIQSTNMYDQGDANFTKFTRVTFTARVMENSEMWSGIPLLSSETDIKLQLTNQGYKITN